ncbi:hypothetical protein LUZ61_009934 [Rhynchospora tenuis]|uniref:Uncharacterized protein n=1 Tax=Rhynchospora tenuis TaxID=198213 RepID=A0AAD5ZYH6_9POAL|nr:hypothetical protein LUZ61_009934 [Rhynchospora tenuis]
MKLVWCPETASKAYIEGVKTLASENQDQEESDVAEFISALAGGWKAQLIIDAQSNNNPTSTSLTLTTAAQHTHGKYVCLSEDETEPKDVMKQLKGVDFLVVDGRRRDVASVVKEARPGPRGMVVVRYNARKNNVVSGAVIGAGMRVVRSVFLPIGEGVDVVHVGVGKGPSLGKSGRSRWIKHIDEDTGEEHLFRR